MKTTVKLFRAALLLASAASALAGVHYVDVNSTNATPPYTNWATAATNIQDAVNAAVAGDEIVVTNGIYATGGRAAANDSTINRNRVAVDRPLTVRSVNGPQSTAIVGSYRIRCVYLTNAASLSGFTLRGASVGGVRCWGYDAVVSNCVISGNSTIGDGAGAFGGTLNNCTLTHNTSGQIFGIYTVGRSLTHCSWTRTGGRTCVCNPTPPCINAGNNSYVTSATDLEGNPRIVGGNVDIGAYEFQSPASMISYAWLHQFNLPINPSTDAADPDGDGVNNYREWLAGSDPTNPFSFPPLLTLIPYGANVILTWPTNAVGFTLQSTTNLVSPAVWSTNSPAPVVIGGQNVIINPITGAQKFYRLVQ